MKNFVELKFERKKTKESDSDQNEQSQTRENLKRKIAST